MPDRSQWIDANPLGSHARLQRRIKHFCLVNVCLQRKEKGLTTATNPHCGDDDVVGYLKQLVAEHRRNQTK
jgi:hypothetical protein